MSRRQIEWRRSGFLAAVLLGLALVAAAEEITGGSPPAPPGGLPPVPVPAHNPVTPAKVTLGEKLFFDPGLSGDRKVSCSGCHRPEHFFTDGLRFSRGIHEMAGARNAGSMLNAAYAPYLMTDGRARNLEDQVQYPVTNPLEMNTTPGALTRYLASEPSYPPLFARAFGDEIVTWERVTEALASFERTLLTGNSALDRYAAGDRKALSEPAQRGWELFRGRAGCDRCHAYSPDRPFFTDFDFHNTGVSWFPPVPEPSSKRLTPDLGRFWVSRERKHIGAFRTPSLRNVAETAPYMHDGSLATLEEVLDFYSRGPRENPFLDPRMRPLDLTADEKADLLAFLGALTGEVSYRQTASTR
jgi:cytochrome c peroxidase